MNDARVVNACVVGYGLAGSVFHAPTIAATPGLRLHGIVQRHGNEAARDWPEARIVRSLEQALDDPQLDLVVVATPNPSHAALATLALEAGRHVVIDKPLATSVAEGEALVDLAARRGRMLSVFHNRRWDGDFLTVRSLVAAGTLGRIVAFESHFDRWRPQVRDLWRERDEAGSGVLFDLGAHLVDAALALFGTPVQVGGRVARERDGAVTDDAFDIDLDYPGLRVRLGASMLAASPRPRYALRGTRGGYVKFGMDPQEAALRSGDFYGSSDWGSEPASEWGELTVVDADGNPHTQRLATHAGDYRAYYADVANSVRTGTPPAVTASQALDVIRVIEAVKRGRWKAPGPK